MSNPTDRLRMAAKIVDFEARRDSQGRLKVYQLPAIDGGGKYEVAGINERYHPTEAAALRQLIESGRYAEAEDYAQRYIASYTDAADRWTPYDAIESYLRDCIFNRGPGGGAKIYQMALGVRVDGDVGPITREAGEAAKPATLLKAMRAARERYEREVVDRDENHPFWKGLVNRWNNALEFAEQFLDLGGDVRSLGARGLEGEEPIREERPGNLPQAMSSEENMAMEDAAADDGEIDGEMELAAERPATRSRKRGEIPVSASHEGLNIRVLDPPLSTKTRSVRPTLIVLHATAGASAMSSINHLRSVKLSYHYIIARDGRDAARTTESDGSTPIIFKCVDDAHSAAHVKSAIPAPSGQGSINLCSIGISLANIQKAGEKYTPGQIDALHRLLAQLKRAHPSLRHLTTHAAVQPWNRSDPLSINGRAIAAEHGFEFFQPTDRQIDDHRP